MLIKKKLLLNLLNYDTNVCRTQETTNTELRKLTKRTERIFSPTIA